MTQCQGCCCVLSAYDLQGVTGNIDPRKARYCAHCLRAGVPEKDAEIDRLTAALHRAKAHPEFSYLVLPAGAMEQAQPQKDILDAGGWEINEEWEHAGNGSGDVCWRRKRE